MHLFNQRIWVTYSCLFLSFVLFFFFLLFLFLFLFFLPSFVWCLECISSFCNLLKLSISLNWYFVELVQATASHFEKLHLLGQVMKYGKKHLLQVNLLVFFLSWLTCFCCFGFLSSVFFPLAACSWLINSLLSWLIMICWLLFNRKVYSHLHSDIFF